MSVINTDNEIREAYRIMEAGEAGGKMVVVVE
jgi:hypothetical protein